MSESKKYTVEIFGHKYSLVAGVEDSVEECAGLVDTTMKSIAQKLPRDTQEARIAVLTALQLADTLRAAQSTLQGHEDQQQQDIARAQKLFDVIDHILLVDGI